MSVNAKEAHNKGNSIGINIQGLCFTLLYHPQKQKIPKQLYLTT